VIREVENYLKKTKVMKKGIAFPTCISVNKKVCNVSPVSSDTSVISENDVVRM
jgi:methionine aminopeptidase